MRCEWKRREWEKRTKTTAKTWTNVWGGEKALKLFIMFNIPPPRSIVEIESFQLREHKFSPSFSDCNYSPFRILGHYLTQHNKRRATSGIIETENEKIRTQKSQKKREASGNKKQFFHLVLLIPSHQSCSDSETFLKAFLLFLSIYYRLLTAGGWMKLLCVFDRPRAPLLTPTPSNKVESRHETHTRDFFMWEWEKKKKKTFCFPPTPSLPDFWFHVGLVRSFSMEKLLSCSIFLRPLWLC